MPGILEAPVAIRRALARRSPTLAQCIPASSLVGADTVITRAGTYLRAWQVQGVPWETTSPQDLLAHHEVMCSWLRSLPGGEWRIYRYRIQRRATARLSPIAGACYAATLHEDVVRRAAERPFLLCEFFIVLEYVPPRLAAGNTFGSDRRSAQQIAQDEEDALRELDEKGRTLERALNEHAPLPLAEYEHQGVRFSRLAEFIGFTVNGKWARVRADCGLLFQVLPVVRASANEGVVELDGLGGKRFAVMLDVKEYPRRPQVGMLNGLLLEPEEFLEVQAWQPMTTRDGVATLDRQHNYLMATEDVSKSQRDALKAEMDATQAGDRVQGVYAYGLAVFGDSIKEAQASANRIVGSVMQDACGLQMAVVDLLPDDAWKLQCPGNFGPKGVQPRSAEISNRAAAALMALHEVQPGKRWGNPWGEALWLARTASGRVFWASLHASPLTQDAEGEKFAGNVLITGITGAGKTVLQNMLLAFMGRWYPVPRLAWLDYNRANEAFMRRIGARYFDCRVGRPTGINPFRRPLMGYPTPGELQQWRELVEEVIWDERLGLLDAERDDIAIAVQRISTMPSHMRGLTRLRENLSCKSRTDPNRPSVFERLKRWCQGGDLAWVFDGPDLLPDPATAEKVAFDYSEFIERPELCRPLLLAIVQYLRGMLGHGRIVIGGDEVWKAITNETIAGFFRDMEKTARHADGLVIQTTQEPADHAESRYGRTSISQTATFIALADEKADHDTYCNRFGWSEVSLEIIRSLRRDGVRKCLFWQPSNGDPVKLELDDLSGMDEHLAFLSGAKENLPLLDAARAEAGDDPDAWAPLFLAAVRERRTRNSRMRGNH